MKVSEKTKKEVQQARAEVLAQSLTLISGAFALVAALAWNDAIKLLIERFFNVGADLVSKFIYAVVVTTVFVVITQRVRKLQEKYMLAEKAQDEKENEK